MEQCRHLDPLFDAASDPLPNTALVPLPPWDAWADDPPAAEPERDSRSPHANRWGRRLAVAQGTFYFVTGVWPLVHLRSFLAVTGPKTDLWLVQTVGALLAVFGLGLLVAARRRIVPGEWRLVAGLAALVLALVDFVFVARGVISPIYLADAAVEVAIVAGWCATLAGGRRGGVS